MYFRPLSGERGFELKTEDGDTYKIRPCLDREGLVKRIRAEAPLDQETADKILEVVLSETFWKLSGKTTRNLLFSNFEDVMTHFGEVFVKKIESKEFPEYIATDSKGRYVATILENEPDGQWTVKFPGGRESEARNLNAAFLEVLNNTAP